MRSDVLTEVCFHLDAHGVLPQVVLGMWQAMAAPGIQGLPVRPSAGLVLMSYLDLRIEQLIAESNDNKIITLRTLKNKPIATLIC